MHTSHFIVNLQSTSSKNVCVSLDHLVCVFLIKVFVSHQITHAMNLCCLWNIFSIMTETIVIHSSWTDKPTGQQESRVAFQRRVIPPHCTVISGSDNDCFAWILNTLLPTVVLGSHAGLHMVEETSRTQATTILTDCAWKRGCIMRRRLCVRLGCRRHAAFCHETEVFGSEPEIGVCALERLQWALSSLVTAERPEYEEPDTSDESDDKDGTPWEVCNPLPASSTQLRCCPSPRPKMYPRPSQICSVWPWNEKTYL